MKPIVLSDADVKAVLAGRKTQIRRLVKPQPVNVPEGAYMAPYNHNYDKFTVWTMDNKMCLNCGGDRKNTAHWKAIHQPDDTLWAQETWSKDQNGDYVYRANYGTTEDDTFPPSLFRWRAPISMPKEAARLFLKVINVWVERLQSITEENAQAEGVPKTYPYACQVTGKTAHMEDSNGTYRDGFACVWDKANAERGYSWESNPWVWVFEFKLEEQK